MMVYDNGIYREPTAEELEAWESIPAPEDAEAALSIITGEVTE